MGRNCQESPQRQPLKVKLNIYFWATCTKMYATLQGTHWATGCQGAECGDNKEFEVVVVAGAAFLNYPHAFDSFHQKVARVPDENSNEHEYANV